MPPTDPRDPVLLSLARAGGEALAGAIRGIAALRPSGKPLHPRGEVVRGRLVRHGLTAATGIAWLDEPGTDEVLMRWSRAVGVPSPLPDIHGLALRVDLPARTSGDLLFATTGWSRPTRTLLLPGSSARRPMTTLLPYATPQGPIVLGARPAEGATRLYVASPLGTWQEFAELRETGGPAVDVPVTFDPVLNTLPGLEFPGWVRRLREPAYRTARRSRREQVTVSAGSGASGDREDAR